MTIIELLKLYSGKKEKGKIEIIDLYFLMVNFLVTMSFP